MARNPVLACWLADTNRRQTVRAMVLDARGPDELAPEDLLYEDNHLLVVRKHAGVLAQGDETGDRTVLDMVRDYIRVTCDKRGNVFLGLVHRLDRPVEGVLVLARTSKAAGRLSQQFRERTVQKTYHAVVQGRPSPESRQLDWIMAGKRCLLDFATLAQGPHSTLLEVRPHTGRKHQIRRQLAPSATRFWATSAMGPKSLCPTVASHFSAAPSRSSTRPEVSGCDSSARFRPGGRYPAVTASSDSRRPPGEAPETRRTPGPCRRRGAYRRGASAPRAARFAGPPL